jgi:hypothetical protein
MGTSSTFVVFGRILTARVFGHFRFPLCGDGLHRRQSGVPETSKLLLLFRAPNGTNTSAPEDRTERDTRQSQFVDGIAKAMGAEEPAGSEGEAKEVLVRLKGIWIDIDGATRFVVRD